MGTKSISIKRIMEDRSSNRTQYQTEIQIEFDKAYQFAQQGQYQQAINLSFQFLQSMQQLNQVIQSPVTYFRLAWCYQSKQLAKLTLKD